MKVKQLKELLANVPDDAVIVIETDRGYYKRLTPIWIQNAERWPLPGQFDFYDAPPGTEKDIATVWLWE